MRKPLSGRSSSVLAGLAAQRHGDPTRALVQLDELFAHPPDDLAAAGLMHWIRGLLLHELSRPAEAIEDFARSIEIANLHGSTDVEARARANLAIALLQTGQNAPAVEELNRARRIAPSSAKGLVTYLSALSMQRRGEHREAIAEYDRALPRLIAVGDSATVGMLHLNRGVALIYLDELDAATRELAAAEEVATDQGLEILAAMAAHNLGFLEGQRGHLGKALRSLDRAEARYVKLEGRPRQLPVLHSDRAEILLQAGLANDARRSALRALDELRLTDNVADLIEAQLLLARSCLETGALTEAKQAAVLAARDFRSTQRVAWVTRAVYVGRQAEFGLADAERRVLPKLVSQFERLSSQFRAHGWPVEARDALVFGALSAINVKDATTAERLLTQAKRIRAGRGLHYRARRHLAQAYVFRFRGDHARAVAEVAKGLDEVVHARLDLGSTEARFEMLRFSSELGSFGVELALDRRRPIGVLRALERHRLVSSYLPMVGDKGAAITSETDSKEPGETNEPEPSGALPNRRSITATTDQSEQEVRERSLRALSTQERSQRSQPGSKRASGRTSGATSWRSLRAQLVHRSLVYYFASHGTLSALVVRKDSTRMVELTSTLTVGHQMDFLQFALQRFASLPTLDARPRTLFEREANRLDEMLLAPLMLDTESVTIVPCREVHGILWSALPSLQHRDFTVAPSGSEWLRAMGSEIPLPMRTMVVGGPNLQAADDEVARVSALYRGSQVLVGNNATIRNVLDAFERADLIHVAAHGVFRAESPMFSRLELTDGPLTIYDLEQLPRSPALVILSACETAANKFYPSGGALGTAAALLALGTRAVIAPIQAVADSAARDYMIAFHSYLSSGVNPSRALRLASQDARTGGDQQAVVAAAMFVVIGAG